MWSPFKVGFLISVADIIYDTLLVGHTVLFSPTPTFFLNFTKTATIHSIEPKSFFFFFFFLFHQTRYKYYFGSWNCWKIKCDLHSIPTRVVRIMGGFAMQLLAHRITKSCHPENSNQMQSTSIFYGLNGNILKTSSAWRYPDFKSPIFSLLSKFQFSQFPNKLLITFEWKLKLRVNWINHSLMGLQNWTWEQAPNQMRGTINFVLSGTLSQMQKEKYNG